MKTVAQLSELQELLLTQTYVGDEGLAAIAGLNQLRVLRLRSTSVTSRTTTRPAEVCSEW